MKTNGHSFDVAQFKWFYARRPFCFCAGHPRMILNERSLYECPKCGHTVILLAAGTRLADLPKRDQARLMPLPTQQPLKVGNGVHWVDPAVKREVEEDNVPF